MVLFGGLQALRAIRGLQDTESLGFEEGGRRLPERADRPR